jgi:hypothetical protein
MGGKSSATFFSSLGASRFGGPLFQLPLCQSCCDGVQDPYILSLVSSGGAPSPRLQEAKVVRCSWAAAVAATTHSRDFASVVVINLGLGNVDLAEPKSR